MNRSASALFSCAMLSFSSLFASEDKLYTTYIPADLRPTHTTVVPPLEDKGFQQWEKDVRTALDNSFQFPPMNSTALYEFLTERIPNTDETLVDATFNGVTATKWQEELESLKSDPAAADFVRNILKIPPTLYKAYLGTRVGETEYVYGPDHVWSQCVKAATKTAQFLAYCKMGFDPRLAGHLSNLPSDALSRAVIVMGRKWQDYRRNNPKENISFEAFFKKNWKADVLNDAIWETVPKFFISSALSDLLVKRTGLITKVRDGIFRTAAFVSPVFKQDYRLSYRRNAENNPGAHWSRARSFATTVSSWFVYEIITSYLLAPPARWIGDGIDKLRKYNKTHQPPVKDEL